MIKDKVTPDREDKRTTISPLFCLRAFAISAFCVIVLATNFREVAIAFAAIVSLFIIQVLLLVVSTIATQGKEGPQHHRHIYLAIAIVTGVIVGGQAEILTGKTSGRGLGAVLGGVLAFGLSNVAPFIAHIITLGCLKVLRRGASGTAAVEKNPDD